MNAPAQAKSSSERPLQPRASCERLIPLVPVGFRWYTTSNPPARAATGLVGARLPIDVKGPLAHDDLLYSVQVSPMIISFFRQVMHGEVNLVRHPTAGLEP